MTTLEEAWHWYVSVRDLLRLSERFARRHWGHLDWEGPLGNDGKVASYTAESLRDHASAGLEPLDDLAVLVLFSVFESIVRRRVLSEIEPEGAGLRHPALRSAFEDIARRIEDGSFFGVLQTFKEIDADLVEEVNQVRRYRNWVAHGRKGRRPDSVEPRVAYERLSRFLGVIHG